MSDFSNGDLTPSQTLGPYFKYGLTPNGDYAWNDGFTNDLVVPNVPGEQIRIEGTVFDGDRLPVQDCMLEIWQADSKGQFSDPQDARALSNIGFKGLAVAARMPKVAFLSTRSSPDQCRTLTGNRRRPTSRLLYLRAECCCISIRASISRMNRPTRMTQCCRASLLIAAAR